MDIEEVEEEERVEGDDEVEEEGRDTGFIEYWAREREEEEEEKAEEKRGFVTAG